MPHASRVCRMHTWFSQSFIRFYLLRLAGQPYRPCLPHRSRFKGQMINYAYTDEKKIRKHLLMTRNYHQSKEEGLEFLVAVKCFGYAGGVGSVWVYYAVLDKPDDDD